MDFLMISTRSTKRGVIEIYPKFIIKKSTDLMIRGGDFYAIWIEELGLWSTDEQDALRLIDRELDRYAEENKNRFHSDIKILYMWDAESGMIDAWHKYCQKQSRDNFHSLDEKLIFSNTETGKKDYASKKLSYPLEPGSCSAYDKLIGTLYSPEEREKIEWAIGSIITGDSKRIQKFMVLYGSAGTGKSTILNIIQQLFEGYYSVFDAKALGSSSNVFALEAFRSNPLVAIQHDGDLSRIEDNTRLNSLVSHELMTVNEKFKSTYSSRFQCFLFMGTNKPVKITDARSGLIRRLIDVAPSGKKVSPEEYKDIMSRIKFELGAIATHCRDVYLSDPDRYDDYIPVNMLGASNDFYNFMVDSYHVFRQEDGTTLKAAWEMYKTYCDEAKVGFSFSQRVFKEELRNYFEDFQERFNLDDGTRVRSYYSGFKTDKFEEKKKSKRSKENKYRVSFDFDKSIFDTYAENLKAQYATEKGTPIRKWENVSTSLKEIDTKKLHYVIPPDNHIVIDFDIKDAEGNKSLDLNIQAASKFPPTYSELSKSGQGIHLHYIYSGDVEKLSRVYGDHIEVKVFTGGSSLRRKLTKCNNLPIEVISSGLPMKGEKQMVNFEAIKTEKGLRRQIKRNLKKEIHPGTKPSVDFIYKILEDAYESGINYDISDMRNEILAFAANSTNQSDYCVKLVNKMKFQSDNPSEPVNNDDSPIVFYDIEVFPNLFIVNWKKQGKDSPIVRMINPKPSEIEELLRYRLIGFNCRRYDNHILYARLLGYSNKQLYDLSQKIINNGTGFFGEAYNISYTDIYDFASAGNKKSLKKLEIEMGITHKELGLPWDKPVPEELWTMVAEYCDNDVIATEAAFEHLSADWTARQILADLAGMTVNDTTNTLSQKIIFGEERNPQDEFNYRNLADPVTELDKGVLRYLQTSCPNMVKESFDEKSILPYFPGYKFEAGKSTYRGELVGEGGYVYAEPGMYTNVALLDVASMHPSSVIAECLFGIKYTTAFRDIVNGRVIIKHEEWDKINDILDGRLTKYISRVKNGEMTSKELSNALKTAINSVYGLTSASFDNPFRDKRNKDNIVAKRGALFMIDLKYAVQEKGFTVAHIKTDSIKIPNATPEIIQFVMDFGKKYGYSFEHEDTYEKMCLVNDAVYIAKDERGEWHATGAQFAVPYIFKTLFSKDIIRFGDLCETKSVSTALYLDMNEGLPDVTELEKERDRVMKERAKSEYEERLDSYPEWYKENLEKQLKELDEAISVGHDYKFVGRVGQFCPMLPGTGGGILLREKDGKFYAATGSKGYRWMESEMVKELGKQLEVDRGYYDNLVNEAIKTISKYGDFEWFAADDFEVPEWGANDGDIAS